VLVEVVEGFLVRPTPDTLLLFFYNAEVDSVVGLLFTGTTLVLTAFGVFEFDYILGYFD
jgi:hypothetical protein